MVVNYNKVIHCTTQAQVTSYIKQSGLNWLDADYMPKIDDPAQHEIEKGFFACTQENNRHFYLMHCKFTEHKECLMYTEYPEHDWDKIKQALCVTDEKDSIKDCVFIEAEDSDPFAFLFNTFGFDAYIEQDDYIGTVTNSEDIKSHVEKYNKIIIYHNGKEFIYEAGSEFNMPT